MVVAVPAHLGSPASYLALEHGIRRQIDRTCSGICHDRSNAVERRGHVVRFCAWPEGWTGSYGKCFAGLSPLV